MANLNLKVSIFSLVLSVVTNFPESDALMGQITIPIRRTADTVALSIFVVNINLLKFQVILLPLNGCVKWNGT